MTGYDVADQDGDPILFGKTFVGSEAFKSLFREGMTLVEDTAAYLDGPGRDEARKLSRQTALTYASESMRLTTRLMQIASWLLVQRAVAEGEITPDQALQEKSRVRLNAGEPTHPASDIEALPERLGELIGLSKRLHPRTTPLDALLAGYRGSPAAGESPVAMQQWLVRSAFGGP